MIAFRRWTLVVGALACAACSSGSGSHVTLPSFSDVTSAPSAIQTAARAVVRIGTTDEYATGSFISADGLLLTNNHVLGVGICPIEGCYAQLTFMFQRGSAPQQPQTVYVVPQAVDIGLDMALVQVFSGGPSGAKLDSPNFLTIDALDQDALQGMHVNVVGHPEGALKKWSEGQVVDADGTWVYTDAYILPGNSGSPLLDDAGQIVGLMHRGPTAEDLFSGQGANEYSIGSASSALVAAMAQPLPAAMISVNAPTTSDVVTQNDLVWRNARVANATIDGATTTVISVLGAACDAGLAVNDYASPDALSAGLAPCIDAETWIDCRSDSSATFAVCPPDVSAWQQRFQSVNDAWVALNGQVQFNEVSFAVALLSTTMAQGQQDGESSLLGALQATQPVLDYNLAGVLAAFNVASYQGTNIEAFVRGYASVPDYGLQASAIVNAALWLNDNMVLSGSDTASLLSALASDASVDIGTKLYIEQVQYNSGLL